MPQCPVCHAELSANFGVLICGSCQTALFIDFDGIPKVAGQENEGEASAVTVTPEPLIQPEAEPLSEIPSENYNLEQPIWSQTAHEPPSEETNSYVPTPQSTPPPAEMQPQMSAQDFFNDVVNFGNSEVEDIAGLINYDVKIDGIDSLEVRELVLEELRDKRFGWQIEDIESAITDGSLYLKGLSPVKAIVLIRRVQRLPIHLTWIQNAL